MYAPVLPLMSAQTAKEEKVNHKRALLIIDDKNKGILDNNISEFFCYDQEMIDLTNDAEAL